MKEKLVVFAQKQALNALVFLYRDVLFTVEELGRLLCQMNSPRTGEPPSILPGSDDKN